MKKILIFIPLMSSFVFAIDFCGENINLGDKVNLKEKWKSENTFLQRETKSEICKIYKDKNKIVRMNKTLKGSFLVLPNESTIEYLKIKYDDNHMILEEETEDKSLMKNIIESTKDKILSIDSGSKTKNQYTRMYTVCKIKSKLCTNSIEKGYINQ